jgi:hypothetical protein
MSFSSFKSFGNQVATPKLLKNIIMVNEFIENESFEFPNIESHKYYGSFTQSEKEQFKWISGGNAAATGYGAAISDGGTGFEFPNYINGQQALAMQSTSFIEQTIYLVAGTYEFSLYYMGKNNGIVNPIQIFINQELITTITKQVSGWTLFTYTFNILVAEDKTLRLEGTSEGDVTTGIDLIALSKNDGPMNSNFENLLANISNKTPYAYFRADDYENNEIPAKIGEFTAETSGVTKDDGDGNGADVAIQYLIGDLETGKVDFKVNVPTNFTMCSITRYTSVTHSRMRRIISARKEGDFLHGHWNNKRGLAFYGGFITTTTPPNNNNGNGSLTDWLVMCGKNDSSSPKNVLVDDIERGTKSGGSGGTLDLNINSGSGSAPEVSDFAFSKLLIWDKILTDDEMKSVSDYLMQYLKDGVE